MQVVIRVYTTHLQGYEDEMYCPSEFCLRQKPPREDGMVGGKSLFFECHNPTTGKVEGAHNRFRQQQHLRP